VCEEEEVGGYEEEAKKGFVAKQHVIIKTLSKS
jgi:hypothetical protein